MSEEHTVRVRRLPHGKFVERFPDGSWGPVREGKSDGDRLANMTEEEIEANALSLILTILP